MGWRLFLLGLSLALANVVSGEEIPLTSCDGLPVVQVSMGRMKFFFLLDTAANSVLNLKSFPHGDAQRITVTSWSGASETPGQVVTINDLLIGEHHLRNLTLAAVDLSAIGRACGRQLDGILGIDVLRGLGAVVNLKERVAQLPSNNERAQAAELDERLTTCAQAFNRADESVFSDCFDPNVVLFTEFGDFYGRKAATKLYRQVYHIDRSVRQLVITFRAHHLLGDAIWVDYDVRASMEQPTVVSRGSMLCEKRDGKWRIVHLNSSVPPSDATALASR